MARIKKPEHSSRLIEGLSFVELSNAIYCEIGNNTITVATDDLCMGFPIEEDLHAKAHIAHLKNALLKSPDKTAITQLELTKLHVNSEKFEVYVNCECEIKHATPDNVLGIVSNDFTSFIKILLPLLSLTGSPSQKSILSWNNSFFATNRKILVQIWHGENLPFFQMSKEFCKVVVKSKKQISAFGKSDNSITFYFSDGSWVMGRLVEGDWINPEEFLFNCEYFDISNELELAFETVKDFCPSGVLHCRSGALASQPASQDGVIYPVANLPEGPSFTIKDFSFMLKNANKINMTKLDIWAFCKDNLRGIISTKVENV